jgi:hypothetical protein
VTNTSQPGSNIRPISSNQSSPNNTQNTTNSTEPVIKYEVGRFNDLKKRSISWDGLQIHHAPQEQAAKQVFPNYNRKIAPAITLTNEEHLMLNPTNVSGSYQGTPQQLFEKTIVDLQLVPVPPEAIQNLQNLWIETWPSLFPPQ